MKKRPAHSVLQRLFQVASAAILLSLFAIPAPCPADSVFVDSYYGNITEFQPDGSSSIFADSGLNVPQAMVFDTSGNLYVANDGDGTIEKFTPNGTGTLFAQAGGDPQGLAIDNAGNLYCVNQLDGTVEKFTPDGTGTIIASGLAIPHSVAVDQMGNVYVGIGTTIIKITPGGATTTFANSGLDEPTGLAFDKAGNLYAANFQTGNIEKIAPDGTSSLFAIVGTYPEGIAFDNAGNLYVANSGDGDVEEFTPQGVVTIFADATIPTGVAIIPEPSTSGIVILGVAVWALRRGRGIFNS